MVSRKTEESMVNELTRLLTLNGMQAEEAFDEAHRRMELYKKWEANTHGKYMRQAKLDFFAGTERYWYE